MTCESSENGRFSARFGPSESSLDVKSKISFFFRKLKIFEGKNNITFLVLLRTTYMQKMSEIPVFQPCRKKSFLSDFSGNFLLKTKLPSPLLK